MTFLRVRTVYKASSESEEDKAELEGFKAIAIAVLEQAIREIETGSNPVPPTYKSRGKNLSRATRAQGKREQAIMNFQSYLSAIRVLTQADCLWVELTSLDPLVLREKVEARLKRKFGGHGPVLVAWALGGWDGVRPPDWWERKKKVRTESDHHRRAAIRTFERGRRGEDAA